MGSAMDFYILSSLSDYVYSTWLFIHVKGGFLRLNVTKLIPSRGTPEAERGEVQSQAQPA